MKHPVRDRVLMLFCALCALGGAAALAMLLLGKVSLAAVIQALGGVDLSRLTVKASILGASLALVLLALLLIGAVLPSRKKRSSNFAVQRNENGMVRISLKALETLVQKCLNQHAELKVVTSSLFSDEETIRVDVHISLQSDISMPLAISALQKQIKKYLEACSGVMVSEVRVFVDSTIPATEETTQSPYAIPASVMNMAEALPVAAPQQDAKAENDAIIPDVQLPQETREVQADVCAQETDTDGKGVFGEDIFKENCADEDGVRDEAEADSGAEKEQA